MKQNNITLQKVYLTVPELTKFLGFGNADTQREWRDTGKLQYYVVSRTILYKVSDVIEFIETHKIKQPSWKLN